MKKQNYLKLTLISMFSAIILVMTFIPYLGYITLPGLLSITTLHIIVIIGAITLNDYASGGILGLVWGVTCLLYALYNGTADAAIFLDPRISVVPRILVGLLTVAFYKLALRIAKNKTAGILLKILMAAIIGVFLGLLCHNIFKIAAAAYITAVVALIGFLILFLSVAKTEKALPILFASVLGTFSNTALVLTAISLFGSEGLIQLTGTVKNIFSVVIALNGTIEMTAAAIIAIPCCLALKNFTDKHSA